MRNNELEKMNLHLFDGAVNHTYTNRTTDAPPDTTNDLSPEMRTYYSDYLIDNAEPKLVHDQFGQKKPIPKSGGKVIEFRKYDPLPKALKPLTEGVTPIGRKMNVSKITAEVKQYGDYIELSDMLILTAVDNNIVQATKLIGAQAGETLDTITREVLNGGTNVQLGEMSKDARHLLVGGAASGNDYLTVKAIKMGVRMMKVQKGEKIDGSYIAIVHPDAVFDIQQDPEWINASLYAGSTQLFEGEIGKIGGVRFVETTEAKIFHAENLTADARNLSVKTAGSSATVAVNEAITEDDALIGRQVLIGNQQYEIKSVAVGAAGAASITLDTAPTVQKDDPIYPGEAGAQGRDVYSTLLLAENAYGVTEIEGGGLQHIVKQVGSAGTADPLNQRATVGWKATKTAERLVEQFMLRIETVSTFESGMMPEQQAV